MFLVSRRELFELLVKAFLLGIVLGMTYEVLRIFRRILSDTRFAKSPKLLPQILQFSLHLILDIMFAIVCALATALFLFVCNRGKFRLSVIIAQGLGFFTYYVTIGKLITLIDKRVRTAIKNTTFFVCRKVIFPILYLLCSPLIFLANLYFYRKQQRVSQKHLHQLLTEADNGFSQNHLEYQTTTIT